ncbi:MAG: pilus assembly protein N-terminal domain-containing protein [Bauldia sp.]
MAFVLRPLALLPIALAMAAPEAAAQVRGREPIRIVIDRAMVMPMARPADTVIIGNPLIADATVRDAKTLIVTAKSFGTTNLIVLDATGAQIGNELLTVVPGEDEVVTVYRKADRQTLSCTPVCAPMLTLGDDKAVFDTSKSQVLGRSEAAGAGN